MSYNETLNKLIDQARSMIDNTKYSQYKALLDKLESIIQDHQKILELTSDDLALIDDKKMTSVLSGMKIILLHNRQINENEITNFIFKITERLNRKIETDEEIKQAQSKSQKLDLISNIISNNFKENEELVIEFINECYQKNMLDIESTIKLIFYITETKTKGITMPITNEEASSELIIKENDHDITEELINLFEKYGYDFNQLEEETKNNLKTYVNLDSCEEIMQFLTKHNISKRVFISRQKTISQLMVYKTRTILDEIERFIDNNECTLSRLLSFGNIFISGSKKVKYRDKNNNPKISPPTGFYPSGGGFESFLYCVELYKKVNKLPPDYKMTDEDFVKQNDIGMIKFFTTPKQKIDRNLFLLKKYGYIGENEFPTAIVALIGKHTEYILDRLIEAGLYDYGKKYPSILEDTNFPFRWYKIKRARDFRESVTVTNGMRGVLKNNNNSYMGLNYKTDGNSQVIEQRRLSMYDLVKGGRALPISKRREMLTNLPKDIREDLLPDEVAYREFKHFYEYTTYTPNEIYRYVPKDSNIDSNIEKATLINTIFEMDYKNVSTDNNEDDEYIKLLDDMYGVNNLTYRFYREGNGSWPDVEVLISRPKVIRLINLLIKQNAWLTKDMEPLDKENLLLSVIVKDTILSKNDLTMMRKMVESLVEKEYYQRKWK